MHTHPRCNYVPPPSVFEMIFVGSHKNNHSLFPLRAPGHTLSYPAFGAAFEKEFVLMMTFDPTIHMIHPLAVEDLTHKKVGQPSKRSISFWILVFFRIFRLGNAHWDESRGLPLLPDAKGWFHASAGRPEGWKEMERSQKMLESLSIFLISQVLYMYI